MTSSLRLLPADCRPQLDFGILPQVFLKMRFTSSSLATAGHLALLLRRMRLFVRFVPPSAEPIARRGDRRRLFLWGTVPCSRNCFWPAPYFWAEQWQCHKRPRRTAPTDRIDPLGQASGHRLVRFTAAHDRLWSHRPRFTEPNGSIRRFQPIRTVTTLAVRTTGHIVHQSASGRATLVIRFTVHRWERRGGSRFTLAHSTAGDEVMGYPEPTFSSGLG